MITITMTHMYASVINFVIWCLLPKIILLWEHTFVDPIFTQNSYLTFPTTWKGFLITVGADKFSTRPTSLFIWFDGENISFDASFVIYINSTNIPQIMII
jgi:hypothetical protein